MPLSFRFPEKYKDHAKIIQQIKSINIKLDKHKIKHFEKKTSLYQNLNKPTTKKVVKPEDLDYFLTKNSTSSQKQASELLNNELLQSLNENNLPSNYYAQILIEDANLKLPFSLNNQTKYAGKFDENV